MQNLSLIILRYAWTALFLWFGLNQIFSPESWVVYLPEWTGYLPMPGEMLVQLNGWAEIILAIALFTGLYTRIVATLLALHLFIIAVTAGGAIGMRDAILSFIGVVIALNLPDKWTMDAKIEAKKITRITV